MSQIEADFERQLQSKIDADIEKIHAFNQTVEDLSRDTLFLL